MLSQVFLSIIIHFRLLRRHLLSYLRHCLPFPCLFNPYLFCFVPFPPLSYLFSLHLTFPPSFSPSASLQYSRPIQSRPYSWLPLFSPCFKSSPPAPSLLLYSPIPSLFCCRPHPSLFFSYPRISDRRKNTVVTKGFSSFKSLFFFCYCMIVLSRLSSCVSLCKTTRKEEPTRGHTQILSGMKKEQKKKVIS